MSDTGSNQKKNLGEMLTLSALEERVNFIGRSVFGSDNFNKLMNQALSAQTTLQRGFTDQMAKGLHLYNMPTKDDVVALAEQCDRIEERVVRIETLLGHIAESGSAGAAKPASPTVPRTRKPKAAPAASSSTSKIKPAE